MTSEIIQSLEQALSECTGSGGAIIHREHAVSFCMMSDADCGKIVKGMILQYYGVQRMDPSKYGRVGCIVPMISEKVDNDRKKYDVVVERNRENSKNAGRKSQSNPMDSQSVPQDTKKEYKTKNKNKREIKTQEKEKEKEGSAKSTGTQNPALAYSQRDYKETDFDWIRTS